MNITIFPDLIQGSEEWRALRCGLLTASEMHHVITPRGKPAKSEKMRAHAFDLLSQRITSYVDPRYVSDDMLRGLDDELDARLLYSEKYAQVTEVGFVTQNFGEFTLGYSPDGLVGDDGTIEVKGRRPKLQVECIVNGGMPGDVMVQVQTGLLVSGREWSDFISYSGGLPMAVYRVYADADAQHKILDAATEFEDFIKEAEVKFFDEVYRRRFHPTERRTELEMAL